MARGSHGLPQGATQTTALRMDEQRYLINGRIFAAEEPGLQEALARIHGTPARPRCLCVGGGVEMYVSRFKDFLIPGTTLQESSSKTLSGHRMWSGAQRFVRKSGT